MPDDIEDRICPQWILQCSEIGGRFLSRSRSAEHCSCPSSCIGTHVQRLSIASALAELDVAHERPDRPQGRRAASPGVPGPQSQRRGADADGGRRADVRGIGDPFVAGRALRRGRGLWPAADTPERLQAMSWCAWSYVTYGAAVWSLSTALHPATRNNATSSRPSARWRSWTGCWPCWMAIWPSRPGSWAPRIRWRIWWLARCWATPPFWALRLPRIGMSGLAGQGAGAAGDAVGAGLSATGAAQASTPACPIPGKRGGFPARWPCPQRSGIATGRSGAASPPRIFSGPPMKANS